MARFFFTVYLSSAGERAGSPDEMLPRRAGGFSVPGFQGPGLKFRLRPAFFLRGSQTKLQDELVAKSGIPELCKLEASKMIKSQSLKSDAVP